MNRTSWPASFVKINYIEVGFMWTTGPIFSALYLPQNPHFSLTINIDFNGKVKVKWSGQYGKKKKWNITISAGSDHLWTVFVQA